MAWTPLSGRLNDLPLVLCGPIVRRVTNDSVSVWVALKEAATVRLSVHATPQSSTAPEIEGTASTRQLGQHLHVAVVTAKSTSEATRLDDARVYYYDLDFGSGQTLASPNVLEGSGGLTKIVYPGESRPSFVTPPDDADALVLCQASCRMPHGGDTDGMAGLDAVMAARITSSDRPHQLFLTGDQIYADDVAHVVLRQAIDAAETLLGWQAPEPLPGNPSADKLRVGSRSELLEDDEDFTGETVCHLIRLGEYYAMYLLVWSAELWDSDLPDYPTVVPHKPAKITQVDPFEGGSTQVDSDDKETYDKQLPKLKRFVEKLPAMRRLLANVATYMIFDDHETTDDWFLDGPWAEDNLENGQVTKRVIQNALCAFVIFQGWGNTPDDYTQGARAQLLDSLEALHSHQGATASDWTDIADLLFPEVIETGGDVSRLQPKIRFDYRIDFPTHRLLVLDTRTARGFPKRDFFLLRWLKALLQLLFGGIWNPGAELISEADFPQQLTDSPGPSGSRAFDLIVSAAPVFGHWLVEEFVQPRLGAIARYTVDYEAWSLNRKAFQEFLRRLSAHSPAIVLAGDVHYSLSAAMQYWNDRTGSTVKGVVVQLCCSSAKKSDRLTNFIDGRCLNPQDHLDYFAWAQGGDHIQDGSDRRYVRSAPHVHKLGPGESLVDPDSPTWRYRLRFASDDRETGRGIVPPSPTGHPRNQLSVQHRARAGGSKRMVIGRDNASIISFDWTKPEVRHELWYAFDPDDDPNTFRPYTVHTLSLGIPPDEERPGNP